MKTKRSKAYKAGVLIGALTPAVAACTFLLAVYRLLSAVTGHRKER